MCQLWKTACFLVLLAAGCGGGPGDACKTNDDCQGGFTCQPIEGRDSDFCCPTPPTATDAPNCHPRQ